MIKQKFLTLFVALCCATSMFAYDGGVMIDSIGYGLNFTDRTAGVVSVIGPEGEPYYSGTIVIPSTINYNSQIYSVTTIGEGAFRDCVNLNSIIIPNSVTEIRYEAFYNCSGLTSVTIGNSVTTIGEGAFRDCVNLNSIIIPNSVIEIGKEAFYNCKSLTSISIPNSVTTIGWSAFYNCSDLTSVTIGNSVTVIGHQAFYNCSDLTSVTIGNSVTVISSYAFYNCSKLTSVTIPNSVTTIGYQAFYNCSSLTTITIPHSVTNITNNFNQIGQHGIYSENSAFYGCNNIKSVIWNAKNCNDYNFGQQVETYIIGDSVETIPAKLCQNMTKLTSVVIPNSVKSIGDHAFQSCINIKTITLGNSVSSIGFNTFSDCSNLESITLYNTISSINEEYSFHYCFLLSTIYVNVLPFELGYSHIATAFPTKKIIPQTIELTSIATSPTTISIDIDLTDLQPLPYDTMTLDCWDLEGAEFILNPTQTHIFISGLKPSTTYKFEYFAKTPTEWKDGAFLEVTTPVLELTTLTPKVVSEGNVVVAASTNISDLETNVGFEWRKYNAPPELPSSRAQAILYSGQMEGILHNLSLEYWKVRAYYEAADGTCYYGEWATFDPSQPAYFEPTVHTYALVTDPTANKVQIRGYVMTGTDDVTEQGFEYWFKGAKAPRRVASATPDSVYRVQASGQVMTAILEDLAYSTTYTCRAYAVAGGKTYYGEEVQFLTPEDPRPIYTLYVMAGENGSVNTDVSGQYREGETVTLTATAEQGFRFTQWSDGNTDNPRQLTMTANTELMAFFELADGLEGLTIDNAQCTMKFIHNGQLLIKRNGKIYNAAGVEL